MVKIFVGNLSRYCSPSELRGMFEKYGEVSECEVVRNYAFVQMERLGQAEAAIRALHRTSVRGAHLRVGLAAARSRGAVTKLFVGNLAEPVAGAEVRRLFQPFGRVVDVDVARRAAFVYMEGPAPAAAAIRALDGTPLGGRSILVRLSRSPGPQPPRRFGPGPPPPPPHQQQHPPPPPFGGRPQPHLPPQQQHPHYYQHPAAAGCYRPPRPQLQPPRSRQAAPAAMMMMRRPPPRFFRAPYYGGY